MFHDIATMFGTSGTTKKSSLHLSLPFFLSRRKFLASISSTKLFKNLQHGARKFVALIAIIIIRRKMLRLDPSFSRMISLRQACVAYLHTRFSSVEFTCCCCRERAHVHAWNWQEVSAVDAVVMRVVRWEWRRSRWEDRPDRQDHPASPDCCVRCPHWFASGSPPTGTGPRRRNIESCRRQFSL